MTLFMLPGPLLAALLLLLLPGGAAAGGRGRAAAVVDGLYLVQQEATADGAVRLERDTASEALGASLGGATALAAPAVDEVGVQQAAAPDSVLLQLDLQARAEAEAAAARSNNFWLPSLLQVAVLGVLSGIACCVAAIVLGRRERKGAGYYASGCCGGSLLALAAALLAGKAVLARVAGPAPAGPAPQGPLRSSMQVETFVPFSAAQMNEPGLVHELYREGMQRALDDALGPRRGSVVVADLQATVTVDAEAPGRLSAACEDDPPTWRSSGGHGCQDYVGQEWCAGDGSYGPGWAGAGGNVTTFQEVAAAGSTAVTACCGCGGGYRGPTSSRQVLLNFTMLTTRDNATNASIDAPTPDINVGLVNRHIQKAVDDMKQKTRQATGSDAPRWMHDLAKGRCYALSVDDPSLPPPPPGAVVERVKRQKGAGSFKVAVDAHIRCTAHHSLGSDLQEAGRAALKQKLPVAVKFIEGAAAEGSWLKLKLSDRCNDAAQAEAMRFCISDGTAWADFVSVGPVTLPHNERSVERYVCKVSCDVQRALSQHKQDAVREVNEKVSGFSLDERSIDIACSPSTHQCAPCG